jgi:hypothetical protein
VAGNVRVVDILGKVSIVTDAPALMQTGTPNKEIILGLVGGAALVHDNRDIISNVQTVNGNTVINLTDSNFTKSGKLKAGVKYAKPLTKTERDQNFNVNGLVAGKDYVGGRFRANWHLSINVVENVTFDEVDPSGNETIAALVSAVSDFTAGQVAYLINNLPYAIPLEYGHSKQAPGGMVRITVARFQQIVDEVIRNNQV